MADLMDLVQQRTAEELERNLAKVTARNIRPSAFFCEECGESIPEARRRIVQGVSCCVVCQEIAELKNKHYSKGAI